MVPKAVHIIVIFTCLCYTLVAQNSKKASRLTEKAEGSIVDRDFIKAKHLLKRALEADNAHGPAYLKLAAIYSVFQQRDSALLYYNTYSDHIDAEKIPGKLWLRIAELNYSAGNYQRARTAIDRVPDPTYLLKASIDFSLESVAKGLTLEIEELPSAINQFQLQYFPALTIDENTIIYTKRDTNLPASDEDMVISTRIDGEWIPSQSISKEINTPFNEGACSISADGSTLIFAACEGRMTFGSCDLFITFRQGNKWSTPENLGSRVNSQYWDSQPSLSADGRTLFFSSNRPGGEGKRDIWLTSFDGRVWREPVNLGNPVNTAFDETTPFIHANSTTLFFSSQGHVGLGGYDLLATERREGHWTKPRNLGFPINTHHDELSLFVNPAGSTGYYAKELSKAVTIVESILVKFQIPYDTLVKSKSSYITGRVLDADSGEPIGADFKMTNLNDSSDIYFVRSDSLTGSYFLALTQGRDYGVFVSKKGYLFEDLKFQAKENTVLHPDTINLFLKPLRPGESIVLENIYFEFDEYRLDRKSLSELNALVHFLKSNDNFTFEIQGHTDNIGDQNYNMQLAQSRAKTVYNYLLNNGIPKERMRYKGYGDGEPLASNASESGREKNRRITFVILANH